MHLHSLDPNSFQLRPLHEYTDRLPSSRRGKKLNRSTLWRWVLRGVGGRRLRTQVLGGRLFTCDAWACQFMRPGPTGPQGPDTSSPVAVRERERIAERLGAARNESRA